jgi:hypothetical protein
MDTLFLLMAALITLAALSVGESGARARRPPVRSAGGNGDWSYPS